MEWTFNSSVADIFNSHARQHIPNYNDVLALTVDLCGQKLSPRSPILEIGCAIGETVSMLARQGFTNIHAVDSSQAMIDKCPTSLATYYCTEEFPTSKIKFDAILCNWTLHFISQKETYLKQIFDNLAPGGFLVLSEKTANSGIALEQYHRYKSIQGVSDEDIRKKADSVKNVMFINTPEWYLITLRNLGFNEVAIVNANWCFTTFVAIKA